MTLHFDATDADLALFLEEADEQLRTLSDGLLQMERDASEPQLLQAVFRAAHTLKGSSATIGHTRMAELTHAMESVLDNIRQGALAVSSPVVDALLACVDALHLLNEEVTTREPGDLAVDELAAHLKAVAQQGSGSPAKAAATPAIAAPAGALAIDVSINPSSEWPAVRAYQALLELAALGTVVSSSPTEEELQTGTGGHTLTVVLSTSRTADVLDRAVRGVSDISGVSITTPAAAAPVPLPAEEAAPVRAAPATDEPAHAARAAVSRTVKVDIARLDALMNLVGELVIDRGRLMQVLRELSARNSSDPTLEHLSEITQHLSRLSDDLQEQVMLSRLLPVESVFNRFPRMVRDLARRSGKSVRFVVEGEQTGLDRSVIDEIYDPILHLLRNALDHGIEPVEERAAAGKPEEATLHLSARHEESSIVIEVADDGRGMDPAKLRASAVRKGLIAQEAANRLSDEEAIDLIFAPGFSTAAQVTDVSGRGVGMDIVRTNIERIGGNVKVRTALGTGTIFSIRLPLTLAIIRALLVRLGEAVLTIPLGHVQETLRVPRVEIQAVQRREMLMLRGHPLPLLRLVDIFSKPHERQARPRRDLEHVVVVRSGKADLGLIVDGLVGEQEVVIKSIGQMLGDIDGIAGATILGDGNVSVIVDVPKVVDKLAAVHA